jgi:hypothetical protein
MRLPFSQEAFFDVFAAYNTALWPAVIALWIVSALTAARLFGSRRAHDRWVRGLLALLWAWAALAYHAAFFTRINPAAWAFAGMSLLQAVLLFWMGVAGGRLSFTARHTAWTAFGWALIAYALLYPAINAIEHGTVVRIPTFGVPCPTAILTAGFLLLTTARSWAVAVVPIAWAAIGGSAAFVLGVGADYLLPAAGIALAAFELRHARAVHRPPLAVGR